MQTVPVRLSPGDDLRTRFEALLAQYGMSAGFVVSAIGSLREAPLRFADEPVVTSIGGPLEIVSLAGSLSLDGAHLHMSVADSRGRVHGGHVGHGAIVRTTVEALVVLLPDWSFTREHDLRTGFKELAVRPRTA